MSPSCLLCALDESANDFVAQWTYWRLLVNHNQNYLGKVMLVLKRHATDVTELTAQEQTELWLALRRVRAALTAAFQADHFNYAFLMNQDAHVHLHIIPRYVEPREFEGQTFTDGRTGEHYALTSHIVPLALRAAIARRLRTKGLNQ